MTETTSARPRTTTEPAGTPAGSVHDLATRITGRVVTRADGDWDGARRAWNLAVDQHPEFVVQPGSAQDVAETVNFARAAGMRVAPQGTGHNAYPLGDLSGTILLRTDRLKELTIDPLARTVRAGAGVLWNEVSVALAPHGLVGLAGSAGDVGVAGYLLGGGFSWFARQYGLSSGSINAVELVTGDGQFHRVDAVHEPELFWALRGGCGNVGVVTALEFAAYPGAEVYAGALLYPMARAREIFTTYEVWTRNLAEAAGTCIRLLRIPPMEELPEAMRGQAFVGIDGAIDLPAEAAETLLAPLRALGPAVDMFGPMPGAALGQIHMDPPHPVPGWGDGLLLDDLTAEAIDALLRVAGPDVQSPLLAVDLRHLGGAVGRPDPNGGAIDHLPGRFMLYAVGITPVPAAKQSVQAAAAAVKAALAPWTAARDYPNFVESAVPAARFYPDEVIQRLLQVQRRYDPQGVVRAGHPWTN